MKRVFFGYLAIFALGISFLTAYAPFEREPGLSNQRGVQEIGLSVPDTILEDRGWRDVNETTLGADLIAGAYWTPTVDFSGGTKYYFDPDATAKGDGSIGSPFRALGVEVASDSTIARCDADDYVVDNAANSPAVGPGDVCVLLPGNHGRVEFLQYYFSDYLAIVGVPSGGVTFDYIGMERGQRFYIEGVNYSKKPRSLRADTDTTEMGGNDFDTKPYMIAASRDSNGNGVMEYVIVNSCDFSGGTAAQAAAWDSTGWNRNVVDAMHFSRASYVHVQGNTGSVMGAFVKSAGTSGVDNKYVTIINNTVSNISGDGVRVAYADSLHVVGNYFYDFWNVNEDHVDMVQIWAQSDNLLFEQNMMVSNMLASRDPSEYGAGSLHGFVTSGGDVVDDVTVQNNVIYLVDDWEGITFAGGTNVLIANNTVIGDGDADPAPQPLVGCDGTASSFIVANNIYGGLQTVAGVTATNNIACARDFTYPDFVAYTAQGDFGDFDLHLDVYSPAIRAGSSTYAPATDYAGDTRPDKVYDDIGAYVYDDPDVTAPLAIADLGVTNYYDQIDLSWSAVAASDLDYYNLYRDSAGKDLGSPLIDASDLFDTIAGGTESYTDTNVSTAGDSTYFYRVAAVDSSGNVATLSNVASATSEASLVIAAVDSAYSEASELASVDFTASSARMLSFRHQLDGGAWSSATTLDSAVTAATHYVDTSDTTTYSSGSRVGIMAYYAGEDTALATVLVQRAGGSSDGFIGTRDATTGYRSGGGDHYWTPYNATGGNVSYFYVREYDGQNMSTFRPAIWDTTGSLLCYADDCSGTEVSTDLWRFEMTTPYELTDGVNYWLGLSIGTSPNVALVSGKTTYKTNSWSVSGCSTPSSSVSSAATFTEGGLAMWASNDGSETD